MDRSWIQIGDKTSLEYENGVKDFLNFCIGNLEPGKDKILCPCNKCINCVEYSLGEVEDHLFAFGMANGYTRWTRHGEEFESSSDEEHEGFEDDYSLSGENEDGYASHREDEGFEDDYSSGGEKGDDYVSDREGSSISSKSILLGPPAKRPSTSSHILNKGYNSHGYKSDSYSKKPIICDQVAQLAGDRDGNFDIPLGSSKPKRKRGKTKGYKLAKLRVDGRLEVIFPDCAKRPVGEYSNLFTTEIGVLVRQIAPLQVEYWGDIGSETKDSIMNRLRDKFIFGNDPEIIKSVEAIMAKRYNTWRYNWHEKFAKHKTVAAALSNPPFGITQQDWIFLCNLFSTKKFKARSSINKKNRDKLKTTHCAGTKAFSKIRYDKRNRATHTDLGFAELYEVTHSKADGSWVHDGAKKFFKSLKEHKTKAELEGTTLSDEQLSVLTFGSKSGYIRGLGYGPKPTLSATGKRTRAELERGYNESIKRAELADKKTAELAERLKVLEAEQAESSAKLREEMNSQFAVIQRLLGNSTVLKGKKSV